MATALTNGGRALVTSRMRGSGAEPVYMGWGTGAGTTAATDTSLFTERAADLAATSGTRTTGTSSQQTTSVANDTYQVSGTIVSTGTGSVTNAGLFDNSAIGSGNLFMKGDFSGIPLSPNDSIALTMRVQFT